jgi:16S rRNA G966 N2-methylase RsmD
MRIITGIYKGRRFDIPRSFKARPTTDFAKENIFNVLNSYIDLEGVRALDLFAGTGSISLELLSRGCSQVVSVEADRDHARFIGECVRKLGVTNHQLIRGDVFRYLKSAQKSSTLTRGSAALPAAQQPLNLEHSGEAALNAAKPKLNRDAVAIERGSAALPAAQQPYTAEGPYTPQSGLARGSAAFSFIFADPPYALPNLPDIPDLVLQSGILALGGVFVFEHGKQNDFSSHPCFREHRAYGSVNFTIFTT